jgi:hypothetical protein
MTSRPWVLAFAIGVLSNSACGSDPPAARPSTPAAPAAAAGSVAGSAGAAASGATILPDPGRAGSASPLIPVSQPVAGGGGCKAGHYVGSFSGKYQSGAWFGGAAEIMFATSDVSGKPGFEFWLEAVDKPCTPGQEFCADAVVKGGKLRGNATPFSDGSMTGGDMGAGFSVRFEIDLSGELDCRTGVFKGRLENGCYDILSLLYRFDGTIDGTYSTTAHTFSNGSWHVDEMSMQGAGAAAAPLGGNGVWSAAYADDSAAPSGPGVGLCAGQSGFDTQP